MIDTNKPSTVPCGSCVACCKRDRITLMPEEAGRFHWHFEGGQIVLDRKPNGECVYLDKGCAVHDDQPTLCRQFDCRVLFLNTPKTKRKIRIQQNPTMAEVYRAGKSRLATMER